MFHRTLVVKADACRQILWALMGYLPGCWSALDDAQLEHGTIVFKRLEDESYHLTLKGSDDDPVLLRMWERARSIAIAGNQRPFVAAGETLRSE